jgi:hypothetical protein
MKHFCFGKSRTADKHDKEQRHGGTAFCGGDFHLSVAL